MITIRAALPALLLTLLFAVPAQAELRASTVYNGCNIAQQNAMRTALENVDRDINTVLTRIRAGDIESYWAAWFGRGDRSKVEHTLTLIKNRLETQGTLVLACEERSCDHDLMGYAQTGMISVCPDFFQSELRDHYDSQMGTLVHEFSHMLANTEDHGYGPGEARRLAAQEPDKAIENADNYEYFVEAITGRTIRYGTIAWRVGDSCQWAMDGECDHPNGGTGACEAGTDTTDCADTPATAQSLIPARTNAGRRPSFGPANPRDLCSTALNGICDEQGRGGSNACAAGTDFTDCLTGHMSKTAR